ncbi:anti-phage deoxyguanosine triphosphatase [Epibacterium ulvae]|uniref:anti-phage deoxyguanosine triphosphatase n=1 Tax=Epibacterium ulvae TaxID=1156985 RepID=UPI0024909D53|nr:anti-phage deoxyguanosine triphosphatase [Epibacterium ulvae]
MPVDLRNPSFFEARQFATNTSRSGDSRTQYQRDRARVMHSAGFRRLQGKTQVMGAGEGDFHRTRLTHSIEVAQIGYGILEVLHTRCDEHSEIATWLPDRDLVEAACFAHDLGHPPFGHKGEQALHRAMLEHGGFEGNGQTLRILTKLEKYHERGRGIDPTRRLVLGVLKYPKAMKNFDLTEYASKPPKSFHTEELDVVNWALEGFNSLDREALLRSADGKGAHHSLDCSILELADDIAYGIHDIEDIIARGLATDKEVHEELQKAFAKVHGSINHDEIVFDAEHVSGKLLGSSFERKQMVAQLVNLFIANVEVSTHNTYEHPMLKYNASLPCDHHQLLLALKGLAYELIVKKAKLQQLEWRGQMIVQRIFEVLSSDPTKLIPEGSWKDGCDDSSHERRVCDYIAGMTDSYAEKLYKRLHQPGFGSSGDEL